MRSWLKSFPGWVVYLAVVFSLLLIVFSLFRFWLFLRVSGEAGTIPDALFSDALISGIPYDVMTTSYLLLLPAIAFFIALFLGRNSVILRRGITVYFSLAVMIALLACSADIPYYEFSGSRLNKAIVMWTDTPGTMLKFVFMNPDYYAYLAVFSVGIIFSIWFLLYLQKNCF